MSRFARMLLGVSPRMTLGLAAALTGLSGCQGPLAPPPKPLVVATFYPVWEFSRQVAGDRAEVVSLVPVGVEAHHWEPSPADLARIEGARVLVYNGAGFEAWIDRVLEAVRDRPIIVVNTTDGLPLVRADQVGDRHPGHDHGPARAAATRGASLDPHTWLDPLLARAQVEKIREALARAEPEAAHVFEDNARRFIAVLDRLHARYEEGLARCERRDMVVSHAAFGYLARRYGLLQVPIAGLSPESEPTPADLAAAVRFARRHRVKYVFFETLASARVAETLAREVGARTLVLNPIEGLTAQEAAAGLDYVALMERNLENLRTALECR